MGIITISQRLATSAVIVGLTAVPALAATSSTSASSSSMSSSTSISNSSSQSDLSNNLLPNGCSSPSDCSNKVHSGDQKVTALFHLYRITAKSINDTVPGTVTKSGLVIVNGKIVATQAMSFGRTNLPGSTQVGGLFRRSTSVSFTSDSLPAFVHMTNGKFDFAIIKSCGNLVIATPVMTPAKSTPQPQPAPTVNVTQTQTQSQTQTPAPTVTPAPAPALPQTGAAAVGTAGFSALLVVALYYWRSRRGLQLALRSTN